MNQTAIDRTAHSAPVTLTADGGLLLSIMPAWKTVSGLTDKIPSVGAMRRFTLGIVRLVLKSRCLAVYPYRLFVDADQRIAAAAETDGLGMLEGVQAVAALDALDE